MRIISVTNPWSQVAAFGYGQFSGSTLKFPAPILSHEETCLLWGEMKLAIESGGDWITPRNRMVECNIPIIYWVLKRRRAINVDTAYDESVLALIHAVDTWKPEKCKLSTWVTICVFQAIVSANRSPRMLVSRSKMPVFRSDNPCDYLEMFITSRKEKQEASAVHSDSIADSRDEALLSLDFDDRTEWIGQLAANLPDRYREIVFTYYGIATRESMTLEEVAKVYGVTKERIRQIIQLAFRKMREVENQTMKAGRI